VHRVAVEAFPDVPTGGEPLHAGTYEEFAARDVDRAGVPRDGFVIAVDEATGEAAGYANLLFVPGSTTVALHDMTAVRPSFRGRGIATALKRATIAWAIANGLEALETGNDETNAPMRAVNRALGYRPIPDLIGLQGPLAPAR
jgi:GNAT superfamily N-acetyltransferase